ncbi:Tat pathway signal sequence domain protein [Streptomyces ureilyticus]|uniref:Tat pathway signal sequence domain protein n=1 Tax=Streptomyces ureilyticus TaxID=1775131 RepID=A0ABX0E2W0_9ACTN|nr:Tat pathway signal sequence domain protein [Streptomyces ureilyticus]NGO47169.1 Tat pathway signal sequence domain protein [Streptomyces ureilyticus]
MRKIVHRHLGKVVAGAGIAVATTAVMVAVTLPGSAGADDSGSGAGAGQSGQQAGQEAQGTGQEQGQGAVRPGVVEQAPAEGDTGEGRDPLTEDEAERVEQLALDRQLRRSSENVEGEEGGPQPLTVDLADPEVSELDDADAPRRAEVSFYDYKGDSLVTKTVNLDTGKVEATDTQEGVQPPLSRDENVEAGELLIADPLGEGLKADYKDATGNELTKPDQLLLNSMVYRANAGTPAALADCGEHRCLRLFAKVKNGPWIDTRDLVIDLSARKIAKVG